MPHRLSGESWAWAIGPRHQSECTLWRSMAQCFADVAFSDLVEVAFIIPRPVGA